VLFFDAFDPLCVEEPLSFRFNSKELLNFCVSSLEEHYGGVKTGFFDLLPAFSSVSKLLKFVFEVNFDHFKLLFFLFGSRFVFITIFLNFEEAKLVQLVLFYLQFNLVKDSVLMNM